jgi:hypothetical protein
MLTIKQQVMLGVPPLAGSILFVLYLFLNSQSSETKLDTGKFSRLAKESKVLTGEFSKVAGRYIAESLSCLNELQTNRSAANSLEVGETALRWRDQVNKFSDLARDLILESSKKFSGLDLNENELTQNSITHLGVFVDASANVPKVCNSEETEKLQVTMQDLMLKISVNDEELKSVKLKMLLKAGKAD